MTVIDFPSPERLLWVCACGCRSFTLYADDEIACADCGRSQTGAPGSWREKLPEAPARAEPIGKDTFSHVVSLNDARTFLTRQLRDATRMAEINAVVVLRSSGAMHVWGHDFSGAERAQWLDRRLAEVRETLTK